MYKYNNKEECITSLYSIAMNLGILDKEFQTLMSIEKNLTEEIFEYIKNHEIILKVVDLNLFCLAVKTIHNYQENIVRYDHSDYINALDTLTYTADRVQYYSESQIKIKLPKYPLPRHAIIYLFINHLEEKAYDEKNIKKLLAFFKYKNKPEIDINIETVINKYKQYGEDSDDIFKPNIDLSYRHIIKDLNTPTGTDYQIRCKEDELRAFLDSIDDEFNRLKNLFINMKFNTKGKSQIINLNLCGNLHSKYDRETLQYWDINSNIDILKIVKESISYEICEYINLNESIKLDLFSLGRFSLAAEEDKFLKESDLAHEGNKLRKKTTTLQNNAEKIEYYSEEVINIRIPKQANINISQMIEHLEERGLEKEKIDYLCLVFDTKKDPEFTEYTKENQKRYKLLQSKLWKIYKGERKVKSPYTEIELLEVSKDHYFPFLHDTNKINKLNSCPAYEMKVKELFKAML